MSSILGISAYYHDSAASIIVNGKIITERARGGALSPKMKNMVRNAKKGQKIYIYDVMVAGPDGRAMPIGGLTFKVI